MSYYNSLKQIKNKILQKQVCILTGNLDDFIVPNHIDIKSVYGNNDLITLPQYLSYLFYLLKYDDIKYFNPSLGTIFVNDGRLNISNVGQQENQDGPTIDNTSFHMFVSNLSGEISYLKKTNNYYDKKAYIVDFAEILLSTNNMDLALSKIADLISCFTSVFSHTTSDYIESNHRLIILCRNKNILSHFLTFKNYEICFHNIAKPDVLERKQFILRYSNLFNFKDDYLLSDENELTNASILTNDLSFREILQMARINQTIDVDNFKALYNLVTFDKKESEWEKIDEKKIKSLSMFLNERVKGQKEAIEQIKQTIIRSYVGLSGIAQSSKNYKPKGILFFAGPTGVGKTELAKVLTEFVFGDESKFIRFDMSEYNLEHSDQKLIGAPPGYVGHESGGQLTNAVKEKPFSIILFDEIEKAHTKILDKFLQILEDGRLTSSKGELIDFSETFIIFTSNIGSDLITSVNNNQSNNRKIYVDAIKEFFINRIQRPEILNRIGIKNIVPFNYITDDSTIKEIIQYKFNILKEKMLSEKNISLNPKRAVDFDLLIELIKSDYQVRLGGRGLVVSFESIFIDELVNFLFKNMSQQLSNKDNAIYSVDYYVQNSKLQFEFKNQI